MYNLHKYKTELQIDGHGSLEAGKPQIIKQRWGSLSKNRLCQDLRKEQMDWLFQQDQIQPDIPWVAASPTLRIHEALGIWPCSGHLNFSLHLKNDGSNPNSINK